MRIADCVVAAEVEHTANKLSTANAGGTFALLNALFRGLADMRCESRVKTPIVTETK